MCCDELCSVAFCCVLPCSAVLSVPCCTVFCSVLCSALRCGLFCSVFCSCFVVVLFLFYSCSVLVLFCVLCSVFSFLFDSVLGPALTKTLIICLWYGGAHRRTCSSFFSYGNRLSQEPVHRHFAWNDFELLRPGPLFGFGHFDIVGLHDYKWWNTWTADYWLLCNYIHIINIIHVYIYT